MTTKSVDISVEALAFCEERAYKMTSIMAQSWLQKTIARYSVGLLLAIQFIGLLPFFTIAMIVSYGIIIYIVPHKFRQQLTLQPLTHSELYPLKKQSLPYCILADYITPQLFEPLRDKDGTDKIKMVSTPSSLHLAPVKVHREFGYGEALLYDRIDSRICSQDVKLEHSLEMLLESKTIHTTLQKLALTTIKKQTRQHLQVHEPLAPKAAKLSPAVRRMIAEVDLMMAEVHHMLASAQSLNQDVEPIKKTVRRVITVKSREPEADTVYDGDDEKIDRCSVRRIRSSRLKVVRFNENVAIREAPIYTHTMDEYQRRDLYYDAEELEEMTREYFQSA